MVFTGFPVTVNAAPSLSYPVPIDIEHFPDPNFQQYIRNNIDTDGTSGVLSRQECDAVQRLTLSGKGITDLTGIEYFQNMTYLSVSRNDGLTSLDVSSNHALTNLICTSCSLSSLNVSGLTNLTSLKCENNNLTSLNLSTNTALTTLACYGNQNLSSLNLSANTLITDLQCNNCALTSLNVSNLTALKNLRIHGNQITTIDISNCSTIVGYYNNGVVQTTDPSYISYGRLGKTATFTIDPGVEVIAVNDNGTLSFECTVSGLLDASCIGSVLFTLTDSDNAVIWTNDLSGSVSGNNKFTKIGGDTLGNATYIVSIANLDPNKTYTITETVTDDDLVLSSTFRVGTGSTVNGNSISGINITSGGNTEVVNTSSFTPGTGTLVIRDVLTGASASQLNNIFIRVEGPSGFRSTTISYSNFNGDGCHTFSNIPAGNYTVFMMYDGSQDTDYTATNYLNGDPYVLYTHESFTVNSGRITSVEFASTYTLSSVTTSPTPGAVSIVINIGGLVSDEDIGNYKVNLNRGDETLIGQYSLSSFIQDVDEFGNGTYTHDISGLVPDTNYFATIITPTVTPEGYTYSYNGWSCGTSGGTRRITDSFTVSSGQTTVVTFNNVYIPPEPQYYTVTFNLNGHGSDTPEPQTILIDHLVTRPEDPTDDDYIFGGWYTRRVCTDQSEWFFETSGVTSDIMLYAKWSCYVQFDCGGIGTSPEPQLVKVGGYVNAPEMADVSGYTFDGWYVNPDFSGQRFDFTRNTISEAITLHARWICNSFTVTFDPNGRNASGMPAEQNVPLNGYVNRPSVTPTASGYVFAGWYEDQNGDSEFDFSAPVTGNRIAYAKWKNVYTVTFDPNSGTDNVAVPTPAQVVSGGTVPFPAADPVRPGYRFDGWYTSKAGGTKVTSSYSVTRSQTIYAHWVRTYTVTYDPNVSVQVNGMPSEITVDTGTVINTPSVTPVAENLSFRGWYRNDACTTPCPSNITVTENVTVYAGWNATVTFDTGNIGNAPTPTVVPYNSTIAPPVSPSASGYVFDGWVTSDGTPFSFNTKITENTTLYASWRGLYNVTFETYGYGEPIAAVPVVSGNTVAAPSPAPTADGLEFMGWYTDQQFSELYNFSTPVTGNITLHAKWEATITFDMNGFGTQVPQQKVIAGSSVLEPAEPSAENVHFIGWYTDRNFEHEYNFDSFVSESLTLYAKWEATVTFDMNGHGDDVVITVIAGDSVNAPVPSTEGLTFNGWYLNGQEYTSFANIDADITVQAKWIATVTFNMSGHGNSIRVQVDEGDTVTAPAPTASGLNLAGWYYNGEEFDLSTPITSNRTLFARWEAAVTFDMNGHGDSVTCSVADGESVRDLAPVPTASGYTFVTWYKDRECTRPYDLDAEVTEGLTLYAGWQVSVTFNMNGHGGSNTVVSVMEGKPVSMPSDPEAAGYIFAGWYRDAECKNQPYNSEDPVNTNINLYARWEVVVTLNMNGQGEPVYIHVKEGDTIAFPDDPSANGLQFVDWYTDSACGSVFNRDTVIRSNRTLWAGWNATVRFETQVGSAPDPVSVMYNHTIGELPVLSANGYNFIGWFTKASEGDMITPSTRVTENMTVYAHWVRTCTVTYYLNRDGAAFSLDPVETVQAGSAYSTPAVTPSASGVTFAGWYLDRSCSQEYRNGSTISENTPLYAGWNAQVTYNVGSHGSAPAPVTVLAGNSVTVTPVPADNGYRFAGWFTGINGSGDIFDTSYPVNNSMPVYAYWIRTCNVTYHLNRSGVRNAPSDTTVDAGSNYYNPDTDPSANNVSFGGWYIDEDCTRSFDEGTPVNADLDLYALWNATVTFNSAGIECEVPSPVTVRAGGSVNVTPVPIASGYRFDGWYTNVRYTTRFTGSSVVNANQTVYARWTRTATVSFVSDLDQYVEGMPVDETITSGSIYSIPSEIPTTSGLTFAGWYTDDGDLFEDETEILEDTVLHARWAATVTFDTAGMCNPPEPVSVMRNQTVSPPDDPVSGNYEFGGWLDNNNRIFSFDTPITENITLHAQWIGLNTVSFDTNGHGTVESRTVRSGSMVAEPSPAPSEEGLIFLGWFTETGDQYEFSEPVQSSFTLYAKWQTTVTFDTNGYGGVVPSVNVVLGESIVAPSPTPSSAGRTFRGWFRDRECQNPYDFTLSVNEPITLYAKWEVTVTYIGNGLTADSSEVITAGSVPNAPSDLSSEGVTFDAWYTDDTFEDRYNYGTAVNSDTTLYARWTAQVTYNRNGHGSAPSPATVTVGETADNISMSQNGYVFAGWFTDQGCTQAYSFDDPVMRDMTLYAGWEVPVTIRYNGFGGQNCTVNVMEGGQLEISDPSVSGLTFTGWYINEDCSDDHRFDLSSSITRPITIYAGWQATVSFDMNGHGSVIPSFTVSAGSNITDPLPQPSADLVSFDGWYLDDIEDGFELSVDSNTVINENTVLHAKWNCEVSFDMNGYGEQIPSVTVISGMPVSEPAVPSADNLTFKGWFTDRECTLEYHFTDAVERDITLYARWEAVVTFDMNGVTDDITVSVRAGEKVPMPENPEAEGVVFFRWFADRGLINGYDFDQPVTANRTVYASWYATVTYACGIDADWIPDPVTIGIGNKVERPEDPVAEGYDFEGWYDETGHPFDFDNTFITSDTTVIAHWVGLYNVTFDYGGNGTNTSQTVRNGQQVSVIIPDSTVPGRSFDAWYTEDGEPYDFTSPVESSFTLYARWICTVTFDTQGIGNAPAPVAVTADSSMRAPAVSSVGYNFLGWYTDPEVFDQTTRFNQNTIVSSDMTVYAGWKILSYTVTFDLNGTGDEINPVTVDHGSSVARPSDPSADGYVFGGWFVNPDLSGNPFDFSSEITGDITLYAKWTAVTTPTPDVTVTTAPTVTNAPTGGPTGSPSTSPATTAAPTVTTAPAATTAPTVTSAPSEDTPAPTSSSTTESGVAGFVERLYTVALGRRSDPVGKQDWIDAITMRGNTGADAARGFLYSDEFLNKDITNDHFVRILYRTFFDREPDQAGFEAWVNALNRGDSKQDVIEGFINSTEWANLCLRYGIVSGGTGVPNIEVEPSEGTIDFCTRLYTTCLNRNADQNGLMAWARQLANQRDTGTGAARGFFFSSEFLNQNVDNGEYVARLYRTFMGREPDEAGYNAWVAQLDQGVSREEVFEGFAQSPEFTRICASYGIIR